MIFFFIILTVVLVWHLNSILGDDKFGNTHYESDNVRSFTKCKTVSSSDRKSIKTEEDSGISVHPFFKNINSDQLVKKDCKESFDSITKPYNITAGQFMTAGIMAIENMLHNFSSQNITEIEKMPIGKQMQKFLINEIKASQTRNEQEKLEITEINEAIIVQASQSSKSQLIVFKLKTHQTRLITGGNNPTVNHNVVEEYYTFTRNIVNNGSWILESIS